MAHPINFVKTDEIILRYKSFGYFMLKGLEPDIPLVNCPVAAILEAVIKTPFHYWMGEQWPLGVALPATNANGTTIQDTLQNYKFYGRWGAEKITATDYKIIDEPAFIHELVAAIYDFFGDDPDYVTQVHQALAPYLKNNPLIYHLALDPETDNDKATPWMIWTSFVGFLLIDNQANKLILVVTGDD